VDPGCLQYQSLLVEALQKENLSVDDVNVVCITHSHIDHYRNIGMFKNAKTLEYFGLWDKEEVDDWREKFSANISIMLSPGHDYTGITLFVATGQGLVAICGDVFWKENYPVKPADDAFASDPGKLEESRAAILKTADWIVPGHGRMYKNNKKPQEMPESEDFFHYEASSKKEEAYVCKRCKRQMEKQERCLCRPWLCYNCCECCYDCDFCSCSHKKK